jgi:hypothetical protein
MKTMPGRRVCAGLRILEAMKQLNAEQSGLDLEVRVGMATGEVMVFLAARPEISQHYVAGDVVNVRRGCSMRPLRAQWWWERWLTRADPPFWSAVWPGWAEPVTAQIGSFCCRNWRS